MLCTFSVGENATMDTCDDAAFGQDEVDITMISYVLEASNHGKGMFHVLSDDTDVFVLRVYAELQCKVQMNWWDGTVLCMVSCRGHPWSLSTSHSSPRKKKSQSHGPASNIHQPVAACAVGSSASHVLKSSRTISPT